jgi:SAM-dependent methyltransferase
MTEGLSISFWNRALAEIDASISSTPPREIPRLLEALPLDVFALLQLERPGAFPNLRDFLAPMPSAEVQESWNGAQGRELLRMSVDFVTRVVAKYSSVSPKALVDSDVLDFGCGWGRLLRLMVRYVPQDRLYGVDPWDESLELCRSCGVKAQLALSDYVPQELPFDRRFDLIYAFSVFTHLSRKTMLQVLSTLRRHISDQGCLFVTIRPEEYWHYHDGGEKAEERIAVHRRGGFSFVPHDRVPIDGDVTYGDTTFTLDWLAETAKDDWVIDSTDYCMGDLLQIIVALRPAQARRS